LKESGPQSWEATRVVVSAATDNDAYSIWLHARSAVTSAQYPQRVEYTIAISGLDGKTPAADHYRASCDLSDGEIRLFPISDEELAQPSPAPHGVNFNFNIALSTGRVSPAIATIPEGHPARSADLLGEPLLSPTYMFGLRYAAAPSGAKPETASTLPVIAIVSAQAPQYRVSLIDTPAIGGVPTYHLELTPLRRPKENRLRELWVGMTDYLPRRAVIAGNFTLAPLVDVPWTVDFSVLDGAPYIAHESTAATLYLSHRRVVQNAAIAFDDIREPGTNIFDEPIVTPEQDETALVEPQS
jgi:hypothetical protein